MKENNSSCSIDYDYDARDQVLHVIVSIPAEGVITKEGFLSGVPNSELADLVIERLQDWKRDNEN